MIKISISSVIATTDTNRALGKCINTTVANIARSLKKLGASPKDIIAILKAMKNAGAIHADLEII